MERALPPLKDGITDLIDASFPGGNIVVREAKGADVYLSPDLRDTEGHWFYWYFRVRGAGGKRLTFHFDSNVIGTRGPAVSLDKGWSWQWLGEEDRRTFSYTFPEEPEEVRFSFGIPYVSEHLERFLHENWENPRLRLGTLTTSRKGRPVEALWLNRKAQPSGSRETPVRLLVTCRHHACEAIANYTLEGLLAEIMTGKLAAWYAENVEVLAIPFVDKDGVEDGDQGKNRRPRDHNRDYVGESVHPEVKAIRQLVPDWSKGAPLVAIDLHCPHIRGQHNEVIYLVGVPHEEMWERQQAFGRILERVRRGPLPYRAADNLPYNTGWNTPQNYSQGKNFSAWAAELHGVCLATAIEIPYANVGEVTMSIEAARALGRDLAHAVRDYIASYA